jgi:phosphoribosylaminoimidazolecarboxamide formyltransferase/IMP cyclohydrolase
MIKIRRSLVSCWDKTGLERLCLKLREYGVDIISSGGTAEYLRNYDIPVTTVEEVTGSPEVLDGRVKTLHPAIHAGILTDQNAEHENDLKKIGAQPIQLVVVNLYPFLEKAVKENLSLDRAIEYIDIGGPAMLRAAAKNFQNVISLYHPSQYDELIQLLDGNNGQIPVEYSQKRAGEIFFYTAWYDGQIQRYFLQQSDDTEKLPQRESLFLEKKEELRYGENPHQAGGVYQPLMQIPRDLSAMEQLWGKQLSFNNYMDVNAAWELALEFANPAVVIIKHMNPCGAAISDELAEAFQKALNGDPQSAFGGIVAFNRVVDAQTAIAVSEIFFECIIAPGFEAGAIEILERKKNLRLLKLDSERGGANCHEIKSVNGAYLIQQTDKIEEDPKNWTIVTERKPNPEIMNDLDFIWKVCKHVKSNAIVVGRDLEVYGVGAGQMSRVDSVEMAVSKAKKNGRQLKNTVLASDAFFPFRDSIDRAAEAGVTAVVQPGGSIRDKEVIQAADDHNLVMLFTGIRHFRH